MSFGAAPPGGGMDEYQRLMAERNASAKKKRMLFALVAIAGVAAIGYYVLGNRKKNEAAQKMLDAGGKFAEHDKMDMGPFWSCVMGTDTDVGMFQNADQIQQRVESAYFTQQKTYSEHLTSECVPKLEGARGSLSGLATEMPDALKPPMDKYIGALPKMQEGLESYAEKLKSRGAVKDVDASIQEVGGAFTAEPTAESVAFEKFMVCAIPDLDKKKDIQAVLEFLADTCKKDPVPFMTKVRADCGNLVQNVDKDAKPAPSKTFKANAKKFYEEQQRQLQAWEWCGKKSRKGKKVLDLEAFLTAAGDYIEARGEVVQTAREQAAQITGQPLPKEKKKPGEAGEAEAPPAKK
ncbi:MAG TPA: hypothetical protein VKQ32_29150 [Polyangia bacterium]|nr:hypothetical protein [Polyangia bacterium]